MRTLILGLLAGVGIQLLLPERAAAADWSGDVGLVSDYRFRGISLSNGQPALHGSVSLEFDSGPYLGAWASTIKEPGSALAAEIQLYGGYELPLAEHLSLDLSGNYYAYPGDSGCNYFEATAVARVEHGDVSAGLGFSFVPKQSGTRDELGRHRNRYVFAELSYAIPGTPVSLTSSLGHERGFFDEVEQGGKWDWAAGVELDLAPVRAGVAYVGSDASDHGEALVASLFVDF